MEFGTAPSASPLSTSTPSLEPFPLAHRAVVLEARSDPVSMIAVDRFEQEPVIRLIHAGAVRLHRPGVPIEAVDRPAPAARPPRRGSAGNAGASYKFRSRMTRGRGRRRRSRKVASIDGQVLIAAQDPGRDQRMRD